MNETMREDRIPIRRDSNQDLAHLAFVFVFVLQLVCGVYKSIKLWFEAVDSARSLCVQYTSL